MVSQPDDSIHQELVYLERFVDRRPTWAPVVLGRLGELGQEGKADLPRLLAERTVKAKHLAAKRRAQLASRAAAMAVLVTGAPALIGTPAAAANLPAFGASRQAEMLEVRVTDSQTGMPLAGVTLMTAGEELVGVTDANGAVSVPARYASEPVISLEREGYPMVLVEGSKLSGRSMIAMRHFSAGIDQARTTGPTAALAALARGPRPDPLMASKPLGYAGEPETPFAKPAPVAAKPPTPAAKPTTVAAKPAPTAAKPMNVAAKPQPAATKPTTVAAKPQPAATKPTTVAAKPQPAATKPTTVAAKPESTAAKPTAMAAKPQPVAAKPVPAAPTHLAPPVDAVPATAKAAEPIVPFGAAPKTGEPIAPFTTASQPAAQAPFAKAPSDSAPAPFAKAPADLPEDQTAEHASTTQHAAPTSVASHASPASVAAAAGLPQAKPTAALPAATPIVDAPMAPVASKPVVAMKLPARSPRASQRIRAAELAAAPPAAATVAIAPQNLPMPEAATLPPAAVAQEPAPGWVVVSLPARPRPAAVAKAPEPAPVMARITLPSRPRAPQLASAPHLASTLAKPASASYRVKAGDTLSDIALRELGSSTLWHVVYEANRDQLTNPRWLEVGLTLKIPRGNDAGGQVYVVKQGDSLSKIARLMLGDMKKWRDLYAANKQQIRDPWFIYPGQRLVLPGTQNLACLPVDQRWATLKATVYPPA